MKKKLLAGLFTLTAASMLCGFDSAETVDGVLTKMMEASADAESMSMDMDMNIDVSVNIGDETATSTLNVVAGADFLADVVVNPMAMSMEGTIDVSALGEAQTLAMKMYMVTNDADEMEMYVYTEDSATGEGYWEYETTSMEGLDMDALMEASESMSLTAADYAEWGIVFELAPEAADVEGTECYLLTTSLDMNTMMTVMDKAMEKSAELTGEDLSADETVAESMAALEEMAALLEGLKIDIEYYVDAATYETVLVHMDMNESDMTILNSLLASSMATTNEDGTTTIPTVDIVINDLSFDFSYDMNTVDSITVPEEAIAAIEAQYAETEAM